MRRGEIGSTEAAGFKGAQNLLPVLRCVAGTAAVVGLDDYAYCLIGVG
jgi:hypothetical protein